MTALMKAVIEAPPSHAHVCIPVLSSVTMRGQRSRYFAGMWASNRFGGSMM
jgi:hypothetical protein